MQVLRQMEIHLHDAARAAQPTDSDCSELTTKARYSTMPAVFAGSSWAGLHIIFMRRFPSHDKAHSISHSHKPSRPTHGSTDAEVVWVRIPELNVGDPHREL